MGAWSFIAPYLKRKMERDPVYCGRPVAASPATGSYQHHVREQRAIVKQLMELVAVTEEATR